MKEVTLTLTCRNPKTFTDIEQLEHELAYAKLRAKEYRKSVLARLFEMDIRSLEAAIYEARIN